MEKYCKAKEATNDNIMQCTPSLPMYATSQFTPSNVGLTPFGCLRPITLNPTYSTVTYRKTTYITLVTSGPMFFLEDHGFWHRRYKDLLWQIFHNFPCARPKGVWVRVFILPLIGLTWLITLGRSNIRNCTKEPSEKDGRGGSWFEPVLNTHTPLSNNLTLFISISPLLKIGSQTKNILR